jgi:hypothetical protein
MKKLSTADLAEIIKANPGCVLFVDNAWWKLTRGENPYDEHEDEAARDAWADANKLASDRDMAYGQGGMLEALALLANVSLEYA